MKGLLFDVCAFQVEFLAFVDLVLILLDLLVGVLEFLLDDVGLDLGQPDAVGGLIADARKRPLDPNDLFLQFDVPLLQLLYARISASLHLYLSSPECESPLRLTTGMNSFSRFSSPTDTESSLFFRIQ